MKSAKLYNHKRMHSTSGYRSRLSASGVGSGSRSGHDVRKVATEAGGANMEIDKADSHICSATTMTMR